MNPLSLPGIVVLAVLHRFGLFWKKGFYRFGLKLSSKLMEIYLNNKPESQ